MFSLPCHASSEWGIVHVLVAGIDTGYVSDLMTEAAKYADRSVFVGSSNTSVPDALLASSEGVCVVSSPLHIYSNTLTHNILAAIEKDEVAVEEARLKLRSAVWAHGADDKKFRICNVASVFGTVCRGDYDDFNFDTVDFLLQNAVEGQQVDTGNQQASKDLRKYLDMIAGLEVKLEENAEKMLRSYFLAARKDERGTARCLTALARLCIASARLCCRSTANTEDAVLAIWLHISGGAEPRSAPGEYLDTPVDVKQLEDMMAQFKQWLGEYIARILNDE